MMPVFNAGGFVEQAAGSILGQTMRDLELIVIDDGSTDVSAMILRRLAVEDRRVRFLSRKNEGIVATRNQVLSMARADLVACMDADDISQPQRLARQVRYMKEHPECVALGSAIVVVDPEGQPIKAPPVAQTHAEIDAQLLCGYGWALVQPVFASRRGRFPREFARAVASVSTAFSKHLRHARQRANRLESRSRPRNVSPSRPARARASCFAQRNAADRLCAAFVVGFVRARAGQVSASRAAFAKCVAHRPQIAARNLGIGALARRCFPRRVAETPCLFAPAQTARTNRIVHAHPSSRRAAK
jgi:glycosyltransferase involved in cell wall biosynthesis